MNPYDKAHRSLERPNFTKWQEDQPTINWARIELITLYAIVLLLGIICFAVRDASAQDINSLVPDASITTESDTIQKIEVAIAQIVETPSMDVPVIPMPPITDLSEYKSGAGQELFIYGMMTAMVERADRENFYCQKDLDAGYRPCSFGSIKPRDHYAKIWLADYNALQVKSRENLTALAKDAVKCLGGFEYWPNSGLCNKFATHELCERDFGASVDTIKILNDKYNASVQTIEQLKALVAKLSKKKGKR